MYLIKKYLKRSNSSTTKTRKNRGSDQARRDYIKKVVIAYAQNKLSNRWDFYHTLKVKKESGIIYQAPLLIRFKHWVQSWVESADRLIKRYRNSFKNQVKPRFARQKKTKILGGKKKSHPLINTLKSFFYPLQIILQKFFFAAAFSLIFAGLIFWVFYLTSEEIFKDLPNPALLAESQPKMSSIITDRNGELLFRIYDDENRTVVPLTQIPQSLIDATIAIEDQNFWDHWGFSLKGIVRALQENRSTASIQQGGSTITQQLVKNRLLTKERTLKRKIKELILALMVENRYSKEEILAMYLNQVPYGGSAYGIEAASEQYFGKSAQELSLAEASLLAGLPAAPSTYSPFGPSPEFAFARQAEVLRRMVEDGYITQELADKVSQEQLSFRQDRIEIKAPHFVMYVKQLIAANYGEDLISQGGLEIRTSLDLSIQNQAEKIVADEIQQLNKLKINNGASLVLNPQTGEILSMVGSANYFNFEQDGQVNVVIRPRQPGSSIKPITYSLAFQSGYSPADFIQDTPITFQVAGSPPYSPRNYDGRFRGQVSLREALASSYNVPAVKLLSELGVNNLIDQAEKLGITTWEDRARFGLSLTLGGGEVTMLDLASAYSVFANGGYKIEPVAILEIKDPNGEVLYRNNCVLDQLDCQTKPVLDPKVAYQITHILKDNAARTPAFGSMSSLSIPKQEVAVKTGTTNNLRDNWTIGYTSDRLVATWVGNNDNSPMSYVASGITGASPIWNKTIRLLLDETNPHFFSIPSGVVITNICATTGTLPCAGCPSVREEVFLPDEVPTKSCNSEYFKKSSISP